LAPALSRVSASTIFDESTRWVYPISSSTSVAQINRTLSDFSLDRPVEIDLGTFAGNPGEVVELSATCEGLRQSVFLVGTGDLSPQALRKAGATLGRKVRGKESIRIVARDLTGLEHLVTSCALATYSFSEFKKKSEATKPLVDILIESEKVWPALAKTQAIIDALFLARDLAMTPAMVKSPAWLAAQAHQVAQSHDLKIRIREERELAEGGFGGLLAVGSGSRARGPRFVEISYAPRGSANWPHVVLAGKGIVFDTGGISLKRPYDMMIAMKSDMAGAAAVLAVMSTLSTIAPKIRVTGLMACAENTFSGTAQRPGDVITHFGGITSEVGDTDAEGRLVLADALAYADHELKPDLIIDIATLTGAATLGLGRQYAAMYATNDEVADSLSDVGNEVGERAWRMPLVEDYREAITSSVADVRNIGDQAKVQAGSITAALFLQRFIGGRNWVHLDIAGAGRSDVDAGENVKGATGYGVRLLTQWLASAPTIRSARSK